MGKLRQIFLSAAVMCLGAGYMPAGAVAQMPVSLPPHLQCQVRLPSGQVVMANIVGFETGHWAAAVWPGGYPTIAISSPYWGLPPLMQDFTFWHECGHLNLHHGIMAMPDEFAANCWALNRMKQMGLNAPQIQFIAQYHQSVGPLPQQYGGSGAGFWEITRQACPGLTG